MTTQWIGPVDHLELNSIGFLIWLTKPNGWERYDLRDTPACANMSGRPILLGWAGSHNDLSTNGRGMAKVIRIAKNGRCLLKHLEGNELQAALEELGYPELAE